MVHDVVKAVMISLRKDRLKLFMHFFFPSEMMAVPLCTLFYLHITAVTDRQMQQP